MVPFKKEDEPVILSLFGFDLNTRELIWSSSSFILSILLGIIQIIILGFPVFIPFLTAIPIIVGGHYIALKRVRHIDHYTTLDKHIWLKLKDRFTCKTYLNYRRNTRLPLKDGEGLL